LNITRQAGLFGPHSPQSSHFSHRWSRRGARVRQRMSATLKRSTHAAKPGSREATADLAEGRSLSTNAWGHNRQTAPADRDAGRAQRFKNKPRATRHPKLCRHRRPLDEQILRHRRAAASTVGKFGISDQCRPSRSHSMAKLHFPQTRAPATCCQTAMQRSEHIAFCVRANTSRPGHPDTSRCETHEKVPRCQPLDDGSRSPAPRHRSVRRISNAQVAKNRSRA